MKGKRTQDKTKLPDYGRKARTILNRFKGKKICIVGDIIADIYVFGRPYRLSREAPVVVIEYEEEKIFPGSAGNTINNLLALGAEVFPLSVIGSDDTGNRLMDYFSRNAGIHTEGILQHNGTTVTKTRILAGDTHTSKQQVIRIDRDSRRQPTKKEQKTILEYLYALKDSVDAFILSDYGHGVVDEKVIDLMRDIACDTIVVGDSRYNLPSFKGFTLITPNEHEAYLLSGLPEQASIDDVGKEILEEMDLTALLITRGNRGMSLFEAGGGRFDIPISGSNDVTDVTGAGDTVCATVTLALASGADFYTAARIANEAAGIVVMKRGTATVTIPELKKVIA